MSSLTAFPMHPNLRRTDAKKSDDQHAFTAAAGALEIVKRRHAPTLYIVDGSYRVVLAWTSPVPPVGITPALREGARLPESLESVVRTLVASADEADEDPLIALLTPRTLVRVVPLNGSAGQHHAVFLERYEARAGLATAAERFGLSPRESEVLRHLVKGDSTTEIAKALHIAETTVQDHVKRLSAKMNARKRTEIVARALGSRP